MVDINIPTNNNKINISTNTGTGKNFSVTTADVQSFVINKAKSWAEKMDGQVEAGGYSSKWHATQSAQSANEAEQSVTNAQAVYEDLQEFAGQTLENIETETDGSISEIATAKDNAIAEINATGIDGRANINLSNLSSTGQAKFDAKANKTDVLNKQQITNCLLEVPQNIKLELTDGVLTLKAGSKVIVPSGVGVFEERTVTTDATFGGTLSEGEHIIFDNGGVGGQTLRNSFSNNVFSGNTAPTNANGGTTWYDTTNNIIRVYQNAQWTGARTFPIAKVTVTENGISIDQVFNGMGYIGSTVWIDKGVKGLKPNGRNADGTLNNTEITTTGVKIRTLNTTNSGDWYVAFNPNITWTSVETYSYDEEKNMTLSGGASWGACVFGRMQFTNGKITSFQPKLPVHLADKDDINTLQKNINTVEENSLNKQQITNCLLEVPQNIKLELNNGTLKLKAGSKVIVPNGAGVFDEVVVSVDRTTTQSSNGTRLYFYNGSYIEKFPITQCHSGSTAPTGATYMFWFDTTNNLVKKTSDGGATWETGWSLPFAICTATNATITSIDQTFNGMGYIGSTIFALPGVKGLAPYGRNEDGSCNNREHLLNTAQVYTIPTSANGSFQMGLGPAGVLGYYSPIVWKYDETLNAITVNGAARYGTIFMGAFSATSGVISNFQPKLPFRAVDYSEMEEVQVVVKTYKNGTSWYRVWSDGRIEQGGYNNGLSEISTITLLKAFSDTNYTILAGRFVTGTADDPAAISYQARNITTTSFQMRQTYSVQGSSGTGAGTSYAYKWYAFGY